MPPLFRILTRTDVADPHVRDVAVPTNDAIPAMTVDTRTDSAGEGPYIYEDVRTDSTGEGFYKRDE